MGDLNNSTIRHSEHMLIDQSMIRIPHELLRNNFRAAHVAIERESTNLKASLKDAANAAATGRATPANTVQALDAQIARLRALRTKLSNLAAEESSLHRQLSRRAGHLDKLIALRTVDDVGYEEWSRTRLDRLIIDYMLHHGWFQSARTLAAEREIEDMVDIEAFEGARKVLGTILNRSLTEVLQWALDNKRELRKMESNLEFQIRLQQYIELLRQPSQAKRFEAIAAARKYLIPFKDTYPVEIQHACGLLCMTPPPPGFHSRADPYKELWSPERWLVLAETFSAAYKKLFGLPPVPLLHILLSSGLSALKTPACHARPDTKRKRPGSSGADGPNKTQARRAAAALSGQSICPICSTELHELARNVPCAHHSRSHIDPDPYLLPNGRVYSQARLREHSAKSGLAPGFTRDPRSGDIFPDVSLKKIYVT